MMMQSEASDSDVSLRTSGKTTIGSDYNTKENYHEIISVINKTADNEHEDDVLQQINQTKL